MASSTFTIELSDQDRRRIDTLCKAMCPTGTVAVVVYVETVGFTDGVHLFSSVDDAERWMLQEIRQHGGELFRGPYYAWQVMQRRKKKPVEESSTGGGKQ